MDHATPRAVCCKWMLILSERCHMHGGMAEVRCINIAGSLSRPCHRRRWTLGCWRGRRFWPDGCCAAAGARSSGRQCATGTQRFCRPARRQPTHGRCAKRAGTSLCTHKTFTKEVHFQSLDWKWTCLSISFTGGVPVLGACVCKAFLCGLLRAPHGGKSRVECKILRTGVCGCQLCFEMF